MENAQKVPNVAHEAVDKVANVTHQALDAIDEGSERLKNAEQRMMEDCQGYIRSNPVTSVGIAVAAGFLLSRLLSSS